MHVQYRFLYLILTRPKYSKSLVHLNLQKPLQKGECECRQGLKRFYICLGRHKLLNEFLIAMHTFKWTASRDRNKTF